MLCFDSFSFPFCCCFTLMLNTAHKKNITYTAFCKVENSISRDAAEILLGSDLSRWVLSYNPKQVTWRSRDVSDILFVKLTLLCSSHGEKTNKKPSRNSVILGQRRHLLNCAAYEFPIAFAVSLWLNDTDRLSVGGCMKECESSKKLK